jgi:hypothetical protein
MDALKGMAAAGIAAVTTVTFIHPIDLLKTRLQVSGDAGGRNYQKLGITGSVRIIVKEEGMLSFWNGIPAAWAREASYTSLRIGLYDPIKKGMGVTPDSMFLMKFAAGSLAGALGSVVGNPFDVLKTRMMTAEGTCVLPRICVFVACTSFLVYLLISCAPFFPSLAPH